MLQLMLQIIEELTKSNFRFLKKVLPDSPEQFEWYDTNTTSTLKIESSLLIKYLRVLAQRVSSKSVTGLFSNTKIYPSIEKFNQYKVMNHLCFSIGNDFAWWRQNSNKPLVSKFRMSIICDKKLTIVFVEFERQIVNPLSHPLF